jgi:phage tail sheath protein FI
MKNRVTILDVWGGDKPRSDPAGDPVAQFRGAIGINYLDYAAAYYPWLNTTIVTDRDLSFENISTLPELQTILRTELKLPATKPAAAGDDQDRWQAVDDITAAPAANQTPDDVAVKKRLLNQTLSTISPVFNTILGEVKRKLNLLPPSAAMAGIYTTIDHSRGVWKAPANVSLSAVTSPSVPISALDQEDLNVTPQGKSINAIRSFIGEGVIVWGARTLDGNSLDWRYINVRRTMIMLEESCRLAAKAYVFEPNVANTWVNIRSMIDNFLTGVWKRGGLAGATPEDAFLVQVGLGQTMTADDILEGILRVTVLVAMVRPAEFIEITFQQQMQKS